MSEVGNATPSNWSMGELPPSGYHLAAACLFLIALFGCFNNIVVIVVILTNRCLRTPMNAVLLNLSVNDFIISILGTPLSFVAALHHCWPLGDFLCQAYGFAMTLSGMTAVGTVTVIAIERYIIISKPYRANGLTPKKAAAAIISIWTYSFALSVPPLFGWSRYIVETPGIACSVDWETNSTDNTSYIIYIFAFGYFLPVIIVGFCYGRVIYIVRKTPKMLKKSSIAKAEERVTLMAAAMIVCTLTAWTPYAVVSLIVTFGYAHLVGPATSAIPAIFAKTSVIYNPIVYFFLNSQIKSAILAQLCIKKPEPMEENISLPTNCYYTLVDNVKSTIPATATLCKETDISHTADVNKKSITNNEEKFNVINK